ncbi:hypothetical protein BDV96DRAFT_563013 [Lophiotrema nucula]|uniref:Uncharacterized protein n=1 Tax=Lophiotrema nucula TaxID=690887 RepID=A0A6A5ZSW0_9PLEO|nr:hypothetical protein BDV96DRAFT_563013 [Lophiotrema nucula]
MDAEFDESRKETARLTSIMSQQRPQLPKRGRPRGRPPGVKKGPGSTAFNLSSSLKDSSNINDNVSRIRPRPGLLTAANTAPVRLQAILTQTFPPFQHQSPPHQPQAQYFKIPEEKRQFDPYLLEAASSPTTHKKPPRLTPPALSKDRETITADNISFYAAEGASDPWTSAFSSTRFRGPRRHPPWRELHRLTNPPLASTDDWSENIRWAKQQFQLYGSVWTEYDYHLEQITEHRRETMWVSEEAVRFGRWPRERGMRGEEDGYPGDRFIVHPLGVPQATPPGKVGRKAVFGGRDEAVRFGGFY